MARIAVVEDNEDSRVLLQAVLTRAGHTVTLFEDGHNFFRIAPEQFDLLVCDIMLPDSDGVEIIAAASPHLPCIAYSALDTPALVAALAAGASAALQKGAGGNKAIVDTVDRVLWAFGKGEPTGPVADHDTLHRLREKNVAAETQARLLARMFELWPDAGIVTNDKGVIVLANAQAELLFGYSRDELVGKAVEELIPERFRGAHVEKREAYIDEPRPRSMGAIGAQLYGLRRNGAEFAAEIALAPVPTQEGMFVALAIRRKR